MEAIIFLILFIAAYRMLELKKEDKCRLIRDSSMNWIKSNKVCQPQI
mgnify:CR=1 FL=1